MWIKLVPESRSIDFLLHGGCLMACSLPAKQSLTAGQFALYISCELATKRTPWGCVCPCVWIQINLSLNSALTRVSSSLSSCSRLLSVMLLMKKTTLLLQLQSAINLRIWCDFRSLFLQKVRLCTRLGPQKALISGFSTLSWLHWNASA